MSDPAHVQPDAGPPARLGVSRSRVLEALQVAPGALGIDDVSARVGLHPNTIRFHLAGLVEGGRAERFAAIITAGGETGRQLAAGTPPRSSDAAARSDRLRAGDRHARQ